MVNYNKVLLMGNLTRDPELRFTPSGNPVANFAIAINRVFTDKSGERKEDTSFIRIVVFGKQAQSCSEYLSKGSPVFVEGRIQSRSWEGNDGQKKSTVEVVAGRVQFLGRTRRETKDLGKGTESFPTEAESFPAEDESANEEN